MQADKDGTALPGAVADPDEPLQLLKGHGSSSGSGEAEKPRTAAGDRQPGGQDGNNDAASDAPSAAASTVDDSNVSDYGRGKRLRKLMRLLSSRAALQTVVSFRLRMIVLALVIMVVHMGAFGAVMGFLEKQDNLMDEVAAAGEVLDTMHRIASLTVMLEAAQRGAYFQPSNTASLATDLGSAIDR